MMKRWDSSEISVLMQKFKCRNSYGSKRTDSASGSKLRIHFDSWKCYPPAAHGKDQNGHLQPLEFLDWKLFSFSSQVLSRKHFNTTWISSEIYRMTQKIPKKVLSGISSPQVAISGASVFVAALVPNAVQSPHWPRKSRRKTWWKTLLFHDQQHIPLTTSWPFFSHTHANQRNPCSLISCCNVWIPCSNGNWDVERRTMPTNHFNPSFDSIGPR